MPARRSYFKYYVHDHLYSPVALTNSAGSVEERYEYDAYGNCHILEPNFAPDPDGKSDYGVDDTNEVFTTDKLGNRETVNVRDGNDVTYVIQGNML